MLQEWVTDLVFSPPADSLPDSSTDSGQRAVRRNVDYAVSYLIWGIHPGETLLHTYRLKSADHVGLCLTTRFLDGVSTPPHQHSYIEVAYVISGSFRQHIGDKDVIFKKDDLVIVQRNVMHYDYLSSDGCVVLFLNVPLLLFEQLFTTKAQEPRDPVIDLLLSETAGFSHMHAVLRPEMTEAGETVKSLEAVLQEVTHDSPGSWMIICGHLIRMFHAIMREYHINLPYYSQKDIRKVLFEDILQILRNDCRNTTVETLQSRFFYNRDYFNRLVREFSGLTFRELRQQIRLELASQLLLETDTRIEDIAAYIGYENLTYFYRLFEQRFKQTPRAYRLSRHDRIPG